MLFRAFGPRCPFGVKSLVNSNLCAIILPPGEKCGLERHYNLFTFIQVAVDVLQLLMRVHGKRQGQGLILAAFTVTFTDFNMLRLRAAGPHQFNDDGFEFSGWLAEYLERETAGILDQG